MKNPQELQKLSLIELEKSLEENKKAISIYEKLIESHEKIVQVIEPLAEEHPSRQDQLDTNESFINDYEGNVQFLLEEVEQFVSEIIKRKVESIPSSFELLGFSSWFSGFQIFVDSIHLSFEFMALITPYVSKFFLIFSLFRFFGKKYKFFQKHFWIPK